MAQRAIYLLDASHRNIPSANRLRSRGIQIFQGTVSNPSFHQKVVAISDHAGYRSHLCGYDLNMTYPEDGTLPDIPVRQPRDRTIPWMAAARYRTRGLNLLQTLQKRYEESEVKGLHRRDRDLRRELWKRDLSERVNGTIDPWVRRLINCQFAFMMSD